MVGRNFGCGSSREHAVWAVMQAGYRAVIAPGKGEGFADIFESNAFQNGLLVIELDDGAWQKIATAGREHAGTCRSDHRSSRSDDPAPPARSTDTDSAARTNHSASKSPNPIAIGCSTDWTPSPRPLVAFHQPSPTMNTTARLAVSPLSRP